MIACRWPPVRFHIKHITDSGTHRFIRLNHNSLFSVMMTQHKSLFRSTGAFTHDNLHSLPCKTNLLKKIHLLVKQSVAVLCEETVAMKIACTMLKVRIYHSSFFILKR